MLSNIAAEEQSTEVVKTDFHSGADRMVCKWPKVQETEDRQLDVRTVFTEMT